MFCPVCKTEYREGFMRCSDCGATLVTTLPSEPDVDPGPAEVLWAGIDANTFAAIKAALQEADLPFEDNQLLLMTEDRLTRRPYEIWTYKRDHDAAQRALASLHAEPSPEPIAEQEEGQGNSRELPEEPAEEPPAPVADDLVENFDADEATSEIWSGEEASMAKFLQDSLQANGIGCVIRAALNSLSRTSESALSERSESNGPSLQRLLVRPADQPRAREIIREVLEATPPE